MVQIPADGYCIAYYFPDHFKEPIDQVLDCHDKKFRENGMTFFQTYQMKQFSIKTVVAFTYF